MIYTLIKHGVLTNESARMVLSILKCNIKHFLFQHSGEQVKTGQKRRL